MKQMGLSDWQKRLEDHFRALSSRRLAECGDKPIFALEHGLDQDEVSAIADAVRVDVRENVPYWNHRLPWIVYATEFGYIYSGDEYWQTFEKKTQGWQAKGDRHWIRRCFIDFHEQYRGAKPTGLWASHFSIICWPITHAILPRDLQRQLAKLLFELRNTISSDVLASSRRLGDLIASRSWGTSSRFRQLAQEPLFIGQIAAALLLHEERTTSSLILPATLSRISQDLDRERRARTWMRSARDNTLRKLRIQGTAAVSGKAQLEGQETEDQPAEVMKLGIEPQLVLRPSEEGAWDILVELPDFSHVIDRFPKIQEALVNSRCRVAGSSERPLARGRLLYGSQRILLREWPSHQEPILNFEPPIHELDYLLETECFIRPGPKWLFKVAGDGLAFELRTARVRAGHRYVLLCEDSPAFSTHPAVRPAMVNCDRVHGIILDLPGVLTPELRDVLNELGLVPAGTVRLWPVGLTPTRWDGEGHGEWLSTQIPCIGLRADHHVEGFSVSLGGQILEAKPEQPGAPVFIELPGLSVGKHTLNVFAKRQDGEITTETGILDIKVREPRIWTPGRASQGALFVIVDPNAPTLEQFWEDEVDFEIHGPRGYPLECIISLFRRGESTPYLQQRLPSLRLPISTKAWHTCLEKHFKGERKVQNAYDLTYAAEINLRANELGAFTLVVEREFTPLRWAVSRTKNAYILRVLNDSGSEMPTEVSFYDFNTPDIVEQLDATQYCVGEDVEVTGGLYVARSGDYQRAVIIPLEVRSFNDLRIHPEFRYCSRTSQNLVDLLFLMCLWSSARSTGSIFSRTLRRHVIESMLRHFYHILGGKRWAAAERPFGKSTDGKALFNLSRAVSPNNKEARLGTIVVHNLGCLAQMTTGERVRYLADLSCKYLGLKPIMDLSRDTGTGTTVHGAILIRRRTAGSQHPGWLSEFALRLASSPTKAAEWAGDDLTAAMTGLIQHRALARAARLMVLSVGCQLSSADGGLDLSSVDWQWL